MNGHRQSIFQFGLEELPKGAAPLAKGREHADNPLHTAIAEVPMGKGKVILSQVFIEGRLGQSSPIYDPVTARLLLNMLEGKP